MIKTTAGRPEAVNAPRRMAPRDERPTHLKREYTVGLAEMACFDWVSEPWLLVFMQS